MKKLAPLFLVAAIIGIGVVSFHSPRAEAGAVWQSTLVSSDAGSSQVQNVNPQTRICLYPSSVNTCFRLYTRDGGTASPALDCTKDPQLPNPSTTASAYPYCMDTGSRTGLVVAQTMDGGSATTQFYVEEQNRVRY